MDLLIFILELFASAATDDAASEEVQVSADFVIVSAVDEILWIFVTKDKKFVLDIKFEVFWGMNPNVWLFPGSLLFLSLSVVLLLHGWIPEVSTFLALPRRSSCLMFLSFIHCNNYHLIVFNAGFKHIVESKDLALFGDFNQIQT